jgi:hypothetical protein
MAKKFKKAPGWLGLSEDRTSFVYIPERAQIVRQIFDLSIAGMGGYTIAKLLNSKNVPAFGTSKRWDQSTIHNMLIPTEQPTGWSHTSQPSDAFFYCDFIRWLVASWIPDSHPTTQIKS